MHKKIMLLCLCISIVTLISCTLSGNTGKNQVTGLFKELNIPYTPDTFNYDVDEKGNIYVADKEQINVYNNNGDLTKKIGSFKDCVDVDINNGSIYALDTSEKTVKIINSNGKVTDTFNLSDKKAYRIKAISDKLFVICENEEYEAYIAMYDMKTCKSEIIDKYKNAFDILEYDTGSVLICTESVVDSSVKIIEYRYETRDEGITKRFDITNDLFYDSVEQKLYLCNDNTIKRYDLTSEEEEVIYSSYSSDTRLTHLAANNENLVAADKNTGKFLIVDKHVNEKNDCKLAMLTSYPADDDKIVRKACELLSHEYPSFQLNILKLDGYELRQKLRLKLMSNDDDFDIVTIYDIDIYSYAKADAFLDLSRYNQVMDEYNKMFEGFGNHCCFDGKVIGVPFAFSGSVWLVNTDLLDTMKVELPDNNWTWDDLYTKAREYRKDITGDGKPDTYILSEGNMRLFYIISQYNAARMDLLNNKVSYNNEEFIGLLNLIKKLHDEGLIKPSSANNNNNDVLFREVGLGGLTQVHENNKYILPPTFKNKRSYWCNLELFCINKNSKNIELAVNFLSKFLNNEKQDTTAYNMPDPPNYFDLYKELVKYSSPQKGDVEINKYIIERLDDFLEGKFTADNFAALIQEKADMVFGE